MTVGRVEISKLLSAEKVLERVYFYTSSTEKYLQARRYFDQRGLVVDYFKSRTDPYDEDESGTSTDLLTKALADVVAQIGAGSLMFIEDTSLRIHALSSERLDYPGLRVKEWFSRTTFEECDAQIAAAGGDRGATVKSDVALHLPGLSRPVFFHGETVGTVAPTKPTFDANPQYPWLTPTTFNGWFIPDGHDKALGALSPEVSWNVDFRIRAFSALVERLEEYSAALNLPPNSYRRRRRFDVPQAELPRLFDDNDNMYPAILAVGRTCAGKTTLSEYLSGRHGLRNIEASSVVRSLTVPHLDSDDSDGFAYAMRVLDTFGHDVVARMILDTFGSDLQEPFVVSGLRDIAEVALMKQVVPRCLVVLVEASERTRFDRHVRRARPGAETTMTAFRRRDRRQDNFGLLPIVEDVADIKIINDGRMEEFHAQIDLLATSEGRRRLMETTSPRHGPLQNQLYRCLRILSRAEEALQCDQIESLSESDGGRRIRHNNANKVLRAVPALASRIDPTSDLPDARVRYRVTAGGQLYLELMSSRPGYGAH